MYHYMKLQKTFFGMFSFNMASRSHVVWSQVVLKNILLIKWKRFERCLKNMSIMFLFEGTFAHSDISTTLDQKAIPQKPLSFRDNRESMRSILHEENFAQ